MLLCLAAMPDAPAPHILIVDDEADVHLFIEQLFKRRAPDWSFVSARDGLEALDRLAADPAIDLVLADINMPRLDGLALLERIQAMDRSLRVVIISAYGDMANIRTAMNRGAYDFITKPINRKDLEATIRKTWAEVQETRAAEEARARATALQHELEVARQVQEAKARFFADLSHEFRTPLTLILGPLRDALSRPQLQVRDEDVVAMHRQAQRLKRLIDQLLDLAKLEAGRMTLRAARHDVVAFLEDLVGAFTPTAERQGLTLRFVPSGPAPSDLYVDADKLEKVVANLLANALTFTPEGGTVRVGLQVDPASVTIEVRDSGPGIPDEALPHLFDRFFQVGDARPPGRFGTGIGLALVRELVELHGGTVEVESEVGFGSVFRVTLLRGTQHLRPDDLVDEADAPPPDLDEPVRDPWLDEAAGIEPEPDEPLPDDAPVVLVVEDEADVRAYVRRVLSVQYRVVEAATGAEALARLREAPPDLVVSDIRMPGLSGLELCRAIRADAALAHLPVILLTALASEEDRLEGLGLGADAYLAKPFNSAELLVRVENLIEVRRMLRDRYGEMVVLKPADVAVPSADAAFVERVRAYIEAHMGEAAFDVASVADAVGVSPRQLRRKLRAITGLSPSALVRTLRLQRAAQLLEGQTGTVSEIAWDVGFMDAKYFAQLFKQVYGVAPSEYGGGPSR